MFNAQYLFKDTAVFSPWYSRQGDTMNVAGELCQTNGLGASLSIQVFTKASEDSGDGTVVAGGGLTVSSVGRGDKEFSGLKNLVRFKISNPSILSGAYILFRILPISWYDEVKA